MELIVVDVSNVIHAGHSANKDKSNLGMPIGGLSYLFNIISKKYKFHNMVFLFDSETNRKLIDNNYKSKRVKSNIINTQTECAYYLLSKCGFSVLKVKGYEADDIAYNLCEYVKEINYTDKLGVNVSLLTSDLDWCVNISKDVDQMGVSTNSIQNYNFYNIENIYGGTPLGKILNRKVLEGDKSDGLLQLSASYGGKLIRGSDIYKKYLQLSEPLTANMTDLSNPFTKKDVNSPFLLDKLMDKISKGVDNPQLFLKNYENRKKVVYPLILKEDFRYMFLGNSFEDNEHKNDIKQLMDFYKIPVNSGGIKPERMQFSNKLFIDLENKIKSHTFEYSAGFSSEVEENNYQDEIGLGSW